MHPDLIDYGIQSEQTHLRAHVCVVAQQVYIYPTVDGIRACESGRYPLRPAYTGKTRTAEGYVIPPGAIDRMMRIAIHPTFFDHFPIRTDDTTSQKGTQATAIIREMLRYGHFPIPCIPDVVTDRAVQITGVDITVQASLTIQVKCDYFGGERDFGGTGNLYIQIAELNPYASH